MTTIIRICFLLLLAGMSTSLATVPQSDSLIFICRELLGRPTNNSIVINACTNSPAQVYYEYGTDSLFLNLQSAAFNTTDSVPFIITLQNLQANARYFYRMRYRVPGATTYGIGTMHYFHTQRQRGSTFRFAIEADPHMDTNSTPAVFTRTLQNILLANPDFLLDLGDTFMSEKLPVITPLEIVKRHLLLRSYFDIATHSTPLFLIQGNHDGELGWRHNNTAECMPVWNSNIRKQFYPNPQPDAFYSGNSKSEPYVGLRENYYAWEWGDALFIVLDIYWYTKAKPGWGWTLGEDQYNWFKQTISNSTAKFKFVFCHQLVGGNGNDGRGGIEFAPYFENGGRNADSTWGFDTFRNGWQKPIHTLMVENGANVFFHGHDHFYGKQELDGVVYQEVPQPSLKSYTNLSAGSYGYVSGTILPNRGYLLVTVTDSIAKVEYIRTYLPNEENTTRHNLDVSHSYTLLKRGSTGISSSYLPNNTGYQLEQNFPNPFNPATTISYSIEQDEHVLLRVYDILGKEITTLVNSQQPAGTHSISWTPAHSNVSSGIYVYTLQTDSFRKSRKMICLQ